MKVLFSTERYIDASNHDRGLAPHDYCMIGAYEHAMTGRGASYTCWHYDDNPANTLIDACLGYMPDLVVATATVQLGERNVPPETYRYIRDELKIPVIMVWLESAPDVVRVADMYAPSTTATVFVDTAEHWKQFTDFPELCHWLPEPKDPRIFNANLGSFIKRDVPISFIGSVLGRADRAFNLAALWSAGIDVQRLGGGQYGKTSIYHYADCLKRSVATLNFASAVSFQHINARLSESLLCGALLLESDCLETTRLLEPYRHFVPFEAPFHIDENPPHQLVMRSSNDLIDKIRHYTGPGRDEAERIAKAGQAKAVELFDGKVFWESMFKLAGLQW